MNQHMRTNFATLDMIAERRYEPMATSSESDRLPPVAARDSSDAPEPAQDTPRSPDLYVVQGGNDAGDRRRTGRGRYRRQRKLRLRLTA